MALNSKYWECMKDVYDFQCNIHYNNKLFNKDKIMCNNAFGIYFLWKLNKFVQSRSRVEHRRACLQTHIWNLCVKEHRGCKTIVWAMRQEMTAMTPVMLVGWLGLQVNQLGTPWWITIVPSRARGERGVGGLRSWGCAGGNQQAPRSSAFWGGN